MKAWALALLMLGTALAGCIGSGDDALDTNTELDDPLPGAGDRVVRFTGAGEVLPLVDEVAETAYRLTGHQGAEPTLGITSDGAIFIAAFEDVIRSQDGGESWEVVYELGLESMGIEPDPISNSDPMLWVDTDTDRVYNVPMFPILACASITYSDDAGESWTPAPPGCGLPPPFDHQKFATGPPSAQAPPGAGMAYPNVAVMCYGQIASNVCMTSYDGGNTWPIQQPVWNLATSQGTSCPSQNGHPAFSQEGIIALGKAWSCGGLYLVVSEDSGVTWALKEGPQVGSETIDPEVAFTPDGTLYALWQDGDHRTVLARSSDVGDTWEGPWTVSAPGLTSTVFAGMAAGDDGRLAMAFLGTDDTDEYPSDAPEDTRWHLYVVTTEDADAQVPTFTSHQVTPEEDPVQVGCVHIGGGGTPCRNMLDFIDATAGPNGTFHVAYTEGCTDACAGDPDAVGDESRDRQAALAVLDGWSLYEEGQPVGAEDGAGTGSLVTAG